VPRSWIRGVLPPHRVTLGHKDKFTLLVTLNSVLRSTSTAACRETPRLKVFSFVTSYSSFCEERGRVWLHVIPKVSLQFTVLQLYWNNTYLLTYLRSWALLEKLTIMQSFKKFPAFYGTRSFITVFTRALHRSLSWARSTQSIPSHLSKISEIHPLTSWSS
jgi:hypothetical protein